MTRIIKENYPKASKEYPCQASDWYAQYCGGKWKNFTESEVSVVKKLRDNDWKIQKGETYLYLVYADNDNKIVTFRANKEMYDICLKYDIFPEDSEV